MSSYLPYQQVQTLMLTSILKIQTFKIVSYSSSSSPKSH